jgi:hypothetical protein
MYYIAGKDKKGNYFIYEAVDDWHDVVDNYEPIDCINGEMVIFDEKGHKFLVGPEKALSEQKLFGKVIAVDVGSWDFKKGEPFLIDTKEVVPEELLELLKDFK